MKNDLKHKLKPEQTEWIIKNIVMRDKDVSKNKAIHLLNANTADGEEHQRERMALHIVHDRLTLVTEWIEETLGYVHTPQEDK